MELSELTYIALFLTGLTAGFIDSIAGGGGMITIPVLLNLGIPPHLALGTNKFQACFGSFTASYYYTKKRLVDLTDSITGIIYTLIGSAIGTWLVQMVNSDFLKYLIPSLLFVIIIYTLLQPKIGEHDNTATFKKHPFYLAAGLALGFYDGFFGPGTGSFWTIAIVLGLGFNLKKATGYTKVFNFTSNVVSLIVFVIGGNVNFLAGLLMGIGQIIGARIGSSMVIKREMSFVRNIFITIVILTTIKLIYDRFLQQLF